MGKIGQIAWNKGKGKCKIMQICSMCGKKHEERHKSIKPKFCSRECFYKSEIGRPSGSSGIKWTIEQKEKLKYRPIMNGEKNWNWQGGIKKYYTTNFRRRLNKMIKERDNNKCTNCGISLKLIVHHKDHNHLNDNLNNLITLCRGCHASIHNKSQERRIS